MVPTNFRLTSSPPRIIANPFLFKNSSKFLRFTSPVAILSKKSPAKNKFEALAANDAMVKASAALKGCA